MSNRLVFRIVAVFAAMAATSPLTVASAAQPDSPYGVPLRAEADWGPVVRLWDHRPDDQSLQVAVTSDGTTYAAWRGIADLHQYVAVKAHGSPWSKPLLVGGARSSPLTTLIPIGRQVVVIWPSQSALQSRAVYPDGSMGPLSKVADFDALPLIPCVDCKTAAGDGQGGLVAVWSEGAETQSFLSYRPAGSGWSAKERVPVSGSVRDVVLAADGTATLLISQGDYNNYQRLLTVDRSANGQWSEPVVVARATAPTYLQSPQLVGNSSGVQAVRWESGPKWFATTLRARFRPAGGAFGPAHMFTDNLAYYSSEFAVDATGQVVAVYEEQAQSYLQILVTRHPPGGGWATPRFVDAIADLWDIHLALNAAGDFVVGAKSFNPGVHLVRCPRTGVCDAVDRHLDVGLYDPQVGYGPSGSIKLFWGSGCKGDVCQSQRLLAQVSAATR